LLHYGRGREKPLGSELPLGKLVEIMLDVLHPSRSHFLVTGAAALGAES
jgi:hypothetical protein